ncbi:MAG: hypothetical protein ACI9C4_001462 [Paraglaciecola sp.]|jgi:hypothetical protein
MKYKYLLYVSIPFVIISCGGNDKESALPEPVTISEAGIDIRTPVPDEINNDIDDSDPIKSRVNTDQSTDEVINDLDDSDTGRSLPSSEENTEDNTENNDIDDSDQVI